MQNMMMTSGAKARYETMRRAFAEKEWHKHNARTRAYYAAYTARRALAEKQWHRRNQENFAKYRAETYRRAMADMAYH